MSVADLLWLIPALPLAAALILGLLSLCSTRSAHGPARGPVAFLALAFPLASAAIVFAAIAEMLAGGLPRLVQPELWQWMAIGDLTIPVGLLLDRLVAVMLLVITCVGSLVILYSVGYMAHDRGFCRFMAYLNLFLFSMIVLVMGDNLLLTFVGWEGVGLCSYLLIGFWNQHGPNNDAARKAFLVNRVGDLAFILGLILLIPATGGVGFGYADLSAWASETAAAGQGAPVLLIVALFLMLLGACGKSAQIPLLTWLPDAMAGPSPVSALIHAGTMVTAGVFLCARMSDLLVLSPLVMGVLCVIALATLLWGAIAGLFHWDIKKVLAYSTISQIGFMFLAASIGAFDVAIFHIVTHACFKATLFLGAGSVIHSLHHEQDIRRMGGLVRLLPLTHIAMALAWWSILGLPLGAGFMSKDLILERALFSGSLGWLVYGLALAGAGLTAIYMTRLMVLVFWSRSRVEHPEEVHEAPATMNLAVGILGALSILIGLVWVALLPGMNLFERFLAPVLGAAQAVFHPEAHHPSWWTMALLAAVGSAVAAAGAWWGWRRWRGATFGSDLPPVSGFAAAWTWGFDRFYDVAILRPIQAGAAAWERWIEPLALSVPRALGGLCAFIGDSYRSLQRARLRINLALSMAGVAIILGVALRPALGATWGLAIAITAAAVAVAVLVIDGIRARPRGEG